MPAEDYNELQIDEYAEYTFTNYLLVTTWDNLKFVFNSLVFWDTLYYLRL